MSCGNLNIVNENTTVVTVPENNTITITDLNSCNVVTAIQQITETVQIGVPGPRGVQGPPGPNSLPGGLDTQIQFNSASQFSGSSNFTFDYTTNTLVLTGSMDITGSLTVNTVNVGQNTLNFIDNTGAILNSISVDNSANVILASGSFEANSFSGSFTGSLQGTSSLATSASYALSASYLIGGIDFSTLVTTASFNAFTSSYNTGSFTGSFKGDGSGLTNISASAVVGLNLSQIISGSYSASIANDQLLVNTGVNAPSFTGSLYGTSSWAINFVSASDYLLILATASMLQPYVLTSATSSMLEPYVLTSQTSSFVLNSQTSSMLSPYALTTQLNSYLTTGSTNTIQTISGSLTINQNLTVLGSQSVQYVTSSQLDISTNIITVNVANPAVRFGGIAVIDSGSSPQGSGSFLYDSVQDEFIFVHKGSGTVVTSSHFLVGPETYDSLGNEIYIPANTILKAVGNEHVTGSNITDTDNVVSINSDTQVTGSLVVSSGISGSFSGSGADLSNIPASAIVGLNLSQIASGSYSASIANNQLLVNTGISASSFTGSLVGTAATASYVSGSIFDSNNLALSASHALTASFALNGGGSPFYYQSSAPPTGSEPITGSMWVSSNTGVEYNLIYDGNSYQWVQQTLPVGPQGPQGVSGTNNIDTLTTTTLVGVLSGDGLTVSATTVSQSLGYVPEDVANKSTDITLSANSDTLYPSQKAVKTYVDTNGNFADEVDYAMIMQQRFFFNI